MSYFLDYISENPYLVASVTIPSLIFLYLKIFQSDKKPIDQMEAYKKSNGRCCVSIPKAGGFDKLKLTPITKPTHGANIDKALLASEEIPKNHLIVKIDAFGVNYADVCIRWGLYASAKKYVGFPITPGFEFVGVVKEVNSNNSKDFKPGDQVFGVSMFGAYSTEILVPEIQVFKLPKFLNPLEAAGLPAVAFTAYYAVFELFNLHPINGNRPVVLVHSAAGGVGSILVQILKIIDCVVVGVVGSSSKVETCKQIGCDLVIDKSKQNLWEECRKFSPKGFDVIYDGNGVETLWDGYESLAAEGKLVSYGFHSMLPKSGVMSMFNYLWLFWNYWKTPRFSPLHMTSKNRSVLCFNLSFLFNRTDMIEKTVSDVLKWIEQGKLKIPAVNEFKMWEIQKAHEFIQSGKSIGKIVISTK